MKKFSEISKNEKIYEGVEKIDSKELIGRVCEFAEVKFLPSQFNEGDYAIALLHLPEGDRVSIIGSKVVVEQLKKFQEQLPFTGKLIEVKSKDGRKYQKLE